MWSCSHDVEHSQHSTYHSRCSLLRSDDITWCGITSPPNMNDRHRSHTKSIFGTKCEKRIARIHTYTHAYTHTHTHTRSQTYTLTQTTRHGCCWKRAYTNHCHQQRAALMCGVLILKLFDWYTFCSVFCLVRLRNSCCCRRWMDAWLDGRCCAVGGIIERFGEMGIVGMLSWFVVVIINAILVVGFGRLTSSPPPSSPPSVGRSFWIQCIVALWLGVEAIRLPPANQRWIWKIASDYMLMFW